MLFVVVMNFIVELVKVMKSTIISVILKQFVIKIVKVKKPKRNKKKNTVFIFYDFETTQNTKVAKNTYKHYVNYCVAQKVCEKCMYEKFDEKICFDCEGGVSKVFEGVNTLDNFLNFVLETETLKGVTKVIAISHNSKSFNCQFVLNRMIEIKNILQEPKLILSGSKIMLLSLGSINFIDSLNYFNMKLSKLPEAFGFDKDLAKGFFPFHMNTKKNEMYDSFSVA